MPIYEYRCRKCGEHIEKRQNISDAPLTTCEGCGGELEKQWSLSGFQFRGEGWYVTDYSSKKSGNGNEKSSGEKKSEKESTESGESASKKTTDSTSAVKSE